MFPGMQGSRKVGILTGGGDCPGLNAVIRAVVKTAVHEYGMGVTGFLDGFYGLVWNRTVKLDFDAVSNILNQGGTILGMSKRDELFSVKGRNMRRVHGRDLTAQARKVVWRLGLSGIICVGGDGTLTVASHLNDNGIPCIGVPKTIDNDVEATDQTFGFDSAVDVATEAVDRLRTTADSHHRVMVLEVMGREAGWIALHAGLGGGGDVILIPEIPFSIDSVCRTVRDRVKRGRRSSIIVVAEGARTAGGKPLYAEKGRLGGMGEMVAAAVEERTGHESRATVLSYLQRGGAPSSFDRVLATRYGHAAACFAAEGRFGLMTALRLGAIEGVPLAAVAGKPRTVPLDSPLLSAARALRTSFGEPRSDG